MVVTEFTAGLVYDITSTTSFLGYLSMMVRRTDLMLTIKGTINAHKYIE